MSIDLVEYKTESVSPKGLKCSYSLTTIDHLTRFAVLVALPDKKERTIAKALVERVFGIFGPPKTLHSDQSPEFKKKLRSSCRTPLVTRKPKRRHIVRKATRCRSVCIRPYMPCFRCIAILHKLIGLKFYRSYSLVTIRLLARRCMKHRSS